MNPGYETADGTLTFAIPVQDSRGVADWPAAMKFLKRTVTSCLGQQGGKNPVVVLGASAGDELPEMPEEVRIARVDHAWSALPEGQGETRWRAIRRDKGLRVAAALQAVQPRGHIMVVDWDDLVSPQLAALVEEHSQAYGWYAESGYIFDGSPLVMKLRRGAHGVFGSTIIQRWDLARVPSVEGPLDLDWSDRVFGSHIKSIKIHEDAGTPLAPLPFPVGAYRIGTGLNVSESKDMVRLATRQFPRFKMRVLSCARPRAVISRFEGSVAS